MEEDVRKRVTGASKRRDERRARGGMATDLGDLLGRERARLGEHLGTHLDLADVVERRRGPKRLDALPVPAEAGGERLGERRHAGTVPVGAVALLERA